MNGPASTFSTVGSSRSLSAVGSSARPRTARDAPARATDDVLDDLSRVVRSQRGPLAALARSEGVNAEHAVDCVQEALCTLLELAQRGSASLEAEDARAMLVTIVRNVARNRRRRHFLARPHEDLDAAERPDARQAAADDAIARAEDHVRLKACVEELCAIQKAVVTLRLLEEQPGEDVAGALGISAGHVAVLLHRAKRELRACMTGTGGGSR
jgi:RNA polymerase sigma-70 factor (ECF subfamily)